MLQSLQRYVSLNFLLFVVLRINWLINESMVEGIVGKPNEKAFPLLKKSFKTTNFRGILRNFFLYKV